tara:strand:- start:18 stop:500 length:483 start_codon:yes stop_codon:yes gene_type:complete
MLIATKSSRINISEEEKTKSIAKIFSKNIKASNVLLFKGELGVGKTTFIKYLINCLQADKKLPVTEIPSPTFNLVYEYQIGELILKHYDLYRINDEKELDEIGIFEDNSKQITLIEWPEKIKNTKIKNIIYLNFEYEEDYKNRYITILSDNKIDFLDEFK